MVQTDNTNTANVPNFPSRPPSPLVVRHDVQVHPTRMPTHVEFEPDTKSDNTQVVEYEPDEKPERSHYDTVKSLGSMISIETIEDNANVPDSGKRDTISWLELEIKKNNHANLTRKLGRSVSHNFERFSLRHSLFALFPLVGRLHTNYSWKKDFVTDLIAGLTIAILHIPQGIAYSFLIGISPVYGLYTSFFPVLIYAFMGSAQHISIGE